MGWIVGVTLAYLTLPLVVYWLIPFIANGNKSIKRRIIIYVLGDLGHSPRICYHASSFSQEGFEVELCGYLDSELPKFVSDDHNINLHIIPRVKNANIAKKVVHQVYHILKHLWDLRGSDYILIQNPPSIPIMPIVFLYRFTGTKVIIDWHNLAFSILKLKLNGNQWHPLVLISIIIEFLSCRNATYHLTVTHAMKEFLAKKFKLNPKRIFVLYDRPSLQFEPFEDGKKYSNRVAAIQNEPFIKKLIPKDFNLDKGDKIIVTSTSFTPDEDIEILLGALKIYENSYANFDKNLPNILCFITGKGPLKEKYMKQVKRDEKIWQRCHIEFVWLSADDYPKLLQLCDYGISLHTSSSGLDLPMKILDMFGSGLPVISSNYPVLDELVKHNVNGLKFMDKRELHESLIFAIKDDKVAESLKKGAMTESRNRWSSSWRATMREAGIIRK